MAEKANTSLHEIDKGLYHVTIRIIHNCVCSRLQIEADIVHELGEVGAVLHVLTYKSWSEVFRGRKDRDISQVSSRYDLQSNPHTFATATTQFRVSKPVSRAHWIITNV